MVVMWLGPLPVVMLYSPRLAEKILTSSKHLSKGFAYGYLEAWLGQGIITRLVIEERQKELEERQWRFDDGRLAFLDLLLDMANNGQLTADEIQQQEEIDEVLDGSDYILPEHLPQLKYLECCVKESLRVCTPVPMIMRQLGADQALGGVTLPAGTQVIINQYMVHRDPTCWPDPEKFDPDRWSQFSVIAKPTGPFTMATDLPFRFLPENSVGRHPFAFIPFSAGSRNCIGQRLVLSRNRPEEKKPPELLYEGGHAELKTKIGIILRPENGIHVFLEKRRPIAQDS
ncbi:hypothetical protein TELCIR_08282 [Teladorsagia circumcincta]|uniref:Unspecific monooxygenase n=1 Tax=Teladorsagia circumcincta TaxID=45464 RepID=A0A2G9UI11_TELCI|nr:hypothetical protein TELCIR_08282 [Teladorsagia circumcincta]